jgi:hypothetical protein
MANALCTSQCKSPPPNRGGGGDLEEKVVSFDWGLAMVGDLDNIFSFGRRCGDESGRMDILLNCGNLKTEARIQCRRFHGDTENLSFVHAVFALVV